MKKKIIFAIMKKSILLFAIIASVFVACDQSQVTCDRPHIENIDYKNKDVYGTWAKDYIDREEKEATSVIFINDKNIEFISKDSLRIYHGYWNFTEVSDLGYIEYKYEIIKNEKLILTLYDPFYDTNITQEYLWRPDLSYIEEKVLSNSVFKLNIKEFLGKWEWVSTENIDNCSEALKKHITDTLENSIIEFKTNTFITHLIDAPVIKNIKVTTMQPYTAIISKKDNNIIDDKVLPDFYSYQYNLTELTFHFPMYYNDKFTGFLSDYGGTYYTFPFIEDNKLILHNKKSKLHITFKRIE